MAAAPAAGAPIVAGIAIGLLGATIYVVCLGLHGVWIRTLGHLFYWLANRRLSFGRLGSFHPLRFLESVSNDVANRLLRRAHEGRALMGLMFHAVAQLTEWIARETAAIARDTLHWATWLQRSHLPRWVKALIYATFPPALLARLVKAATTARLPHVIRTTIVRTTHVVTHDVIRIVKATAGAVAAPRPLLDVFPRLRRTEHDLANLRHRLRHLERVAGVAAAVGLVTVGLKRLGLRCLTGRNGRTLGKRLCGVDPYLLESMLTNATVILSTVSIVELTRGTQKLMPAVTDATGWFVREAPDAWNETPRDALRDALAVLPDFPG